MSLDKSSCLLYLLVVWCSAVSDAQFRCTSLRCRDLARNVRYGYRGAVRNVFGGGTTTTTAPAASYYLPATPPPAAVAGGGPQLNGYFARLVSSVGTRKNDTDGSSNTPQTCECPAVTPRPSREQNAPSSRGGGGRRSILQNVFELGLRAVNGENLEPLDLFDTAFIRRDTSKYKILRGLYERTFLNNEMEIRSAMSQTEKKRVESECVCKCDPNSMIRDCAEVHLKEFTPDRVYDEDSKKVYEVVQLPERNINQTIRDAIMCRNEGSRCNAGFGKCQTINCLATLVVYDKESDDITMKRFPYPKCCSCI